MTIALAVLTAVAALAALRVPEMYLEPGAKRLAAQIIAVMLALYLGTTVAEHGPPMPLPVTFMQVVVICILVLGLLMRVVLRNQNKKR